jgi:hypothetical protein
MFRAVGWVVFFSFVSHFLASVFFPYALLINPQHNHYTIGEVSEEALHEHEESHKFSHSHHHEEEPAPTETNKGFIISVFANSSTFTLSFFNLGVALVPLVLTLTAAWLCLFTLRPGYYRPLLISTIPLVPPPR